MIHPIGTPIKQIRRFDRSTKVHFHCTEHKEYVWCSKEPSVSNWFPTNKAAQELEFTDRKFPCNARCEYVTAFVYEDKDNAA